MKTLLLLGALSYSASALANFGAQNVVKCNDLDGRALVIDQLTGLTGGAPGMYIAFVSINGKAIGFPQPVRKSRLDASFPTTFEGGGILATINSVQSMDIPVSQARGTLQISGDAKASPMLCKKGPAF